MLAPGLHTFRISSVSDYTSQKCEIFQFPIYTWTVCLSTRDRRLRRLRSPVGFVGIVDSGGSEGSLAQQAFFLVDSRENRVLGTLIPLVAVLEPNPALI